MPQQTHQQSVSTRAGSASVLIAHIPPKNDIKLPTLGSIETNSDRPTQLSERALKAMEIIVVNSEKYPILHDLILSKGLLPKPDGTQETNQNSPASPPANLMIKLAPGAVAGGVAYGVLKWATDDPTIEKAIERTPLAFAIPTTWALTTATQYPFQEMVDRQTYRHERLSQKMQGMPEFLELPEDVRSSLSFGKYQADQKPDPSSEEIDGKPNSLINSMKKSLLLTLTGLFFGTFSTKNSSQESEEDVERGTMEQKIDRRRMLKVSIAATFVSAIPSLFDMKTESLKSDKSPEDEVFESLRGELKQLGKELPY